jgi:Pvc16 N-terminal domain
VTSTTYKGIAATTQTLGYLVGTAVLAAVPEARVTLARPEEPAAGSANEPRVNIYLVQVIPDPTMRSNDLPTRDDKGNLVSVPMAPVNLRYLLSFFGASEKAHLMLGAVEIALRSHAVLDPTIITQALTGHPELQDSGLASQVPPVRLVPSSVSLEELARFWSGFLQMPYTVSTLYEAMTVILTAADSPTAALPVARVGGGAGSLPPRLDPLPTVQFTSSPPTVVPISGAGLSDQQQVQVGSVWAALEPSPTGGLQFTLPANVAAGVQGVTLGSSTSGQPAAPIVGAEQQVLRIRPEVTEPAANADNTAVTVTVAPPLQPGQTAVLTLVASDAGADPVADSVQIPLAITAATTTATFLVPAVLPAGQYLTILEVDGVASLPTLVGGVYAEPAVALS